MTLTASSCLFYGDFRYGVIPVIGGAPTFSRNSAGGWLDQTGTPQSAIVNTPRTEWAQLYGEDPSSPTTLGKRRPVLTLAMARTNILLYSESFANAAWTKDAGCAATDNTTDVIDPKGGNAASKLVISVNGNGAKQRGTATVGSNTFVFSVWLRTLSGTHGAVLYMDDGTGQSTTTSVTVTAQWQRFTLSAAFVASAGTGVLGYVYSSTTGTLYAFGAQVEQGDAVSAYIPTTSGSATRAVDSASWSHSVPPQAMMLYVRFVERGTATAGSAVVYLGSGSNTTPQLEIYATGGKYGFYLHNGTSSVTEFVAAAPTIGDTVELLFVYASDTTAVIYQSLNGATPTASTTSGVLAVPSGWSDTKLWLNGVGSSTAVGQSQFASVKMVAYADVVGVTATDRMAELRSFALDSRQGVL